MPGGDTAYYCRPCTEYILALIMPPLTPPLGWCVHLVLTPLERKSAVNISIRHFSPAITVGAGLTLTVLGAYRFDFEFAPMQGDSHRWHGRR